MSTKPTGADYTGYVYAVREQTEQHFSALEEMRGVLNERQLTFIERTACERCIQVIVEAAIGASRHFLKSRSKPIPSEGRAVIERVYEITGGVQPDVKDLRGAVGMRNAIIHDYLNLDWARVERVIKDQKFIAVRDYVKLVTEELLG